MLKIHFGTLSGEIKHPSGYFDLTYDDDWFEDTFVKQMVLDVDKTEVISANNMISPVLGNINSSKISGGVKNLILAYKTDNIIDASHCGDNCAKWFLKIGAQKDLTITLYHIMQFFDVTNTNASMDAVILNNNTRIYTYQEYLDAAFKFMWE